MIRNYGILSILLLSHWGLWAQEVNAYRDTPIRTDLELAQTPDQTFQLPNLKEKKAEPQIQIEKIQVVGNTILTPDEIAETVQRHINQPANYNRLDSIRYELTQRYIAKGYITTSVYLPDQKIEAGTVKYWVVEGGLEQINYLGLQWTDADFLKDYLAEKIRSPLNIHQLQSQLRWLHAQPQIDKVDARLSPNPLRGQSTLDLTLHETRPYQIAIGVHNHNPPSVGSLRGYIEAEHQNIWGHFDELSFEYGHSEGIDDWSIAYQRPYIWERLTLQADYSQNQALVVEAPLDQLDIETESQQWRVGLAWSFVQTSTQYLKMGLLLEEKQSQTTLLGYPFPVQDNGQLQTNSLSLNLHWNHKTTHSIFNFRSQLNQGVDMMGATIKKQGPDGIYQSWQNHIQYLRQISASQQQIYLRLDHQLTSKELLNIQRMSIGGVHSIRGYRQNIALYDSAVTATFEWRMRLLEASHPFYPDQLHLFTDAGQGENINDTRPSELLSSVGVGLTWNKPRWQASLYYAYPFKDYTHQQNDLQDESVYIEVKGLFWK